MIAAHKLQQKVLSFSISLPLWAKIRWFVKDFQWILSALNLMSRVYFTLQLIITISSHGN